MARSAACVLGTASEKHRQGQRSVLKEKPPGNASGWGVAEGGREEAYTSMWSPRKPVLRHSWAQSENCNVLLDANVRRASVSPVTETAIAYRRCFWS